MSETYVLGIDAGGTHTDAVLLACDAAAEELAPGEIGAEGLGAEALPSARLVASAKARTRHDNLPASVREVLAALATAAPGCDFGAISRVTLGATLAVNALVQDRALARGFGVTARAVVEKRFGIRTMQERLKRIYDDVLAARR